MAQIKELLMVVVLLGIISIGKTYAQCPSISDLLDDGYSYHTDSLNLINNDNFDEFGVFNFDDPFYTKVGNYPPLRSFPKSLCQHVLYYMSFDAESNPLFADGPIPFILYNSSWHNVLTYQNSGIAHSFQIKTPSYTRVNEAPDFILYKEGTLHLTKWDTVSTNYTIDSLVRNISQVTTPVFTVQINNPDSVAFCSNLDIVADVKGGDGAYKFLWQWKYANSSSWDTITQSPELHWELYDNVRGELVNGYIYKNCYKFNMQMPSEDIDVKITVLSYAYPDIVDGEVSGIAHSNTVRIKSLPAKYKIANEIYGDKTKGFLILDNVTSCLLPSDTSVTLAPLSSHVLRTNELPFFYNWNGYGGHVKQIFWNGLNNPSSLAHTFIVDYDTPKELIAHFEETKPVTVWNNFDGYDIAADSIKLRDPWYYYQENGNWLKSDDWQDCRPSPMALDNSTAQSYGGVFLNTTTAPSWEPPYYSLANRQNDTAVINRGDYSTKHRLYFLGWTAAAEDAEIRYPAGDSTPVIFKRANAVVRARYKASQMSSSSTAFSNNNQRKIVRLSNGTLVQVYESMGKIWLEKSTDNGQNWSLANNAAPINTYEAKAPSLDEYGLAVAIVYQERLSENASDCTVKMKTFDEALSGCNSEYTYTYFLTYPQYSAELNPVIAWGNGGKGLLIFNRPSSGTQRLSYAYLIVNVPGNYAINVHEFNDVVQTPSNQSLAHPCVSYDWYYDGLQHFYRFHVAWEQTLNGVKSVYYTYGSPDDDTLKLNWQPIQYISAGSGYTQNYNPSIIHFREGARLCWVGQKVIDLRADGTPTYEQKVVFKDPGYWRYWGFGENVNPPQISNSGQAKYLFSWAESTGSTYITKFTDNTQITPRTLLNNSGKDVQLCNGTSTTDFTTTYASLFLNGTAPYGIKTSSNLQSYYPPGKSSGFELSGGREGIIRENNCEFYFCIGDVEVGGNAVEFFRVPEAAPLVNISQLNTYLRTKPFMVRSNSSLNYSAIYGITDSLHAAEALTGGKSINFKVRMIEDATGEEIAAFDNISFTETNAHPYAAIAYTVDLSGVAEKQVRLELHVDTNIDNPVLSMIDKVANTELLAKSNTKRINLKINSQNVTTYALDQNYPNPFNPATTINYQLPKAGIVTLKIYDMLGSEVKVLVNEYKESGKYTAEFNGAGLASGVYVYRLDCNDYHATKKLTLLK